MKRLFLLAAILLAPAAWATTPVPIYCIAATLAPCSSQTQVGNGSQGDIFWKAFGKVNDIGNALSLFAGPPANGDLLIGNGSIYVPATITAGSNVTVTNGPGTITIAATGGGTPGGSTTQVQYNQAGVFTGNSNFTWNQSSNVLNLGASTTPGTVSVGVLDSMIVNGVAIPTPGFALNSNIQGVFEDHSYTTGTSAGAARMYLARSDGSITSPTIVVNGDHLGTIYGVGFNGTTNNYLAGGYMQFLVDGSPSSTAMPSDWILALAGATGAPAQVMRAYSNGGVVIGAPPGGSQGAGTLSVAGALSAGSTTAPITHSLLSATQAAPGSGNFDANAYAILGGSGGNVLAFGQYPTSASYGNFAQWIQSGFAASSPVYYSIVLNPIGGSVYLGPNFSVTNSGAATATTINGVTIPSTSSTAVTAPTTTTAGDCYLTTTTAGLASTGACGSGGMVYPGAGIPISTGTAWSTSITPGTGVDAALAVNTGSAGSFVVNGGALGTPSSGVATNLTGTAAGLNIGGTAANLSGTPALPNGTTATTQTTGDNTTKLATDAFVLANASSGGVSSAAAGGGITITGTGSGPYTGAVTISTAPVPSRTVTTSPTVASTDMGGQINMNVSGGGTLTIPAISSTIFANGQSLVVVNYAASTAAVSSTPTVNSGGGCVTATGIPAGDTWMLLSNGTTIDCIQTLPSLTPTVNAATAGIAVTPSCSINGEITNITSTAYTISAPTNGALTSTAGGTLAATTYYVKSTWVTASGQTVGSTETSLAVAVDYVLNVAAPASPPANATGWDVYVSTATGTETLQASGIGTATAWVEPTTGLVAGAALPATNSSGLFTFNAPTGCTPVDGQKIQVNVNMASGGAASYAANAIYLASSSLALPTTSSGASLQDDFLFQYSTTFSKWKFLTVNQGF